MRAPPLEPTVGLPWVGGQHAGTPTGAVGGAPYWLRNAALGGETACGHPQWGLRCGSLWGYET
eukprot:1385492-Pyramimonas_sp.AAC.1